MVDPARARVLVIEDNIYNYTLIARLLKFLGVEQVEWSRTGRQLLALADSHPHDTLTDADHAQRTGASESASSGAKQSSPDLILLDIHLPHEDGYLTLERLRDSDRLSETRVVAVTAEATEDNMRRAREAGFDGFIAKPIDPDRFPDQVKAALRGEQVWDLGGALPVGA
jgi:two-component system cell cycle response regulator DivK